MKCIEISSFGGPDVLRVVDRPDPAPGPGEVLIDVVAAGVNRPDLMQRTGHYPPPKGVTDIPGLEISGRIAVIGAADDLGPPQSASGRIWCVGDDVCALVAGGGYAERCVAPGVQCLPIPHGVSLVDAAAIPETFFTVWTNVFDRAHLSAGEWLLVHGGMSGIGSTAIQLGVARGSRVIATAGTPEKCDACLQLGATRAIHYKTEDFVAAVKETTDGRGVDVICDIIGGPYAAKNLECLGRDGRLVQIGLIGGATAEIPLRLILIKRLTIVGSTLRIRPPSEKGVIAAALERDVWPLFAAGKLHSLVDARVPLAAAAEAHRQLEEHTVNGKILLTVRP